MALTQLSLARVASEHLQVTGWDQTFDDEKGNLETWEMSKLQTCIASHAMAHQTVVSGLSTATQQPADQRWITWTKSFAPHRVCRVACNLQGSVVAASMDNGTVSILRGADGAVLATKRVAAEGVREPAEISFVGGNGIDLDALLIEPPDDSLPMLVSNMDGVRLNCDSNGAVSEAARSMVIHSLQFGSASQYRTMTGVFLAQNSDIVRIALVDGDGKLDFVDYDLKEKKCAMVQRNINISNEEEDWEVDHSVGLRTHALGFDRPVLVLSATSNDRTKICWLDPRTFSVIGDYHISNKGPSPGRLVTLEPIVSCSEENATALAIAMKFGKDSAKMEVSVIQASLSDGNSPGWAREAHGVYRIPVPDSARSIGIAPLRDPRAGPYSFRCKCWLGGDEHQCHAFYTANHIHDGSAIGKTRLLLQTNKFDEAQNLVQQIGEDVLTNDRFAGFHSSEIALRRLQHILAGGKLLDDAAKKQSLMCLRQLVTGTKSGNLQGKRTFLMAAEALLSWPDKHALCNPPTVKEITTALSGFVRSMSSISSVFQEDLNNEFSRAQGKLEEKLVTMKLLDNILPLGEAVPMNGVFSRVKSRRELFRSIIRQGHFLTAEKLWRTSLQSCLSAEDLVSSVLCITATADPRRYITLLETIVFPSLAINSETLPPLLAWSCQLADEFDDAKNEFGLQDSILLLEIVERQTKRLRVHIHSSFASYAPFVERLGSKRRRVLNPSNSSNGSMDMNTSTLSMGSSHSTRTVTAPSASGSTDSSWEKSGPTILELGVLKGGAKIARPRQRKQAMKEVGLFENDEGVESKLASARCLEKARSLGLDADSVRLRSFASSGGVQLVAKKLVQLYSSASSNHTERMKNLTDHVRRFCEQTGADYDEALREYVVDIAGGKNSSRKAIEESASVARCCIAAKARCQVTLVSLRAALFCRYSSTWLESLSQEAIDWASGDSSLRSELEEASRLLLIDGIVGRYCGEGAKELFHVDNPRHAIRLLEFVCLKFEEESVVSDALDLCEAFTHLSREDACSRIIQNAMLQGYENRCSGLLDMLYKRDFQLATRIFSRVMAFCFDLMESDSSQLSQKWENAIPNWRRKEILLASSCAAALAPIALAHHQENTTCQSRGYSSTHLNEERLEGLIQDLGRLKSLHNDHKLFLSVADLYRPNLLIETSTKLLDPLVKSYGVGTRDAVGFIATQIKRACSLLAGSLHVENTDLWLATVGSAACQLVRTADGDQCLHLLKDLGLLKFGRNQIAARSCLAVALTLCMKVSRKIESRSIKQAMKSIIMASSVLQDNALLWCPVELLEKVSSLGDLCGLVCQVLVRSDEGVGEELDEYRTKLHCSATENVQSRDLSTDISQASASLSLRLPLPELHSTWYVGDGLLLPPTETLQRVVLYCREAMGTTLASDGFRGLHAFVEGRGAHALALRLLSSSTLDQLCNMRAGQDLTSFAEADRQCATALAERYLGGTGNGITSGTVDSQLAIAFLLRLPLKLAFKVYKSSLPTAITTKDFGRVVILASIGKVAGSGDLFHNRDGKVLQNWKRQSKFVSQCEDLALRGKWWGILKQYNVPFDPRQFEVKKATNGGQGGGSRTCSKYVSSIMPAFISSLSRRNSDPDSVLHTAVDFGVSFGLAEEVALQRYVEFLLAPMAFDSTGKLGESSDDIRRKLPTLEGVVKHLIRRIESPENRLSILRKCLVKLERSKNGGDYERLSIFLSLYHVEMKNLLSQRHGEKGFNPNPYLQDLELADRRQDALAILSSYFQGEKMSARPPVSSFFQPFPEPFGAIGDANPSNTVPSILGSESETAAKVFDPLEPLKPMIETSCNPAVASALAPLCLPLGVPRGYVHARSLIARFKKSKMEGAPLPSFVNDAIPVLNRVKNPNDVADLAEWCSTYYEIENEDKLRCLNFALNYAMKASSEAELQDGQFPQNANIEASALERVKRITAAKDLLSDRLAITAILNSVGITTEKDSTLADVVTDLMACLEEQVWNRPRFTPEAFTETLLSESSLLAAEASLCRHKALSLDQFRRLSSSIHSACQAVSDKYSHLHVASIARKLINRWLFHGDRAVADAAKTPTYAAPAPVTTSSVQPPEPRVISGIDEEETMEFVMDLHSLRDDSSWTEDVAPDPVDAVADVRVSSKEHENCLDPNASSQESSEMDCRRASLRIAFVMAYSLSRQTEPPQDENTKPPTNRPLQQLGSKKRGLLAKISATESKTESTNAVDCAKELVEIVFAKSGSSDWGDGLAGTSNALHLLDRQEGSAKTITFAMRYRALRAASILCPQEALEEVVQAGDYISRSCSLKQCSFGAFIAKEIEEMGLPLPHSDLAQLSTMHFPSYARALWRHHRDTASSKGRLLLLILEMYLKEDVLDYAFFHGVLREMISAGLTRTLLLAAEFILSYVVKLDSDGYDVFFGKTGEVLSNTIATLASNIYSDLDGFFQDPGESRARVQNAVETIRRFGCIVQGFSKNGLGQQNLIDFIERVGRLKGVDCDDAVVQTTLERALRHVSSKGARLRLGKSLFEARQESKWISTETDPAPQHADPEADTLLSALARIEDLLDKSETE